jgi:hypothetical protein
MGTCSKCRGDGSVFVNGEWKICDACGGKGGRITYGIPKCCDKKMKWTGTDGSFENYRCGECGNTESIHKSRL